VQFGAFGEEAQVLLAIVGVVGEGGEVDQVTARRDQRALDLPRLGDAREADLRPRRRRTGRNQSRDEDGQVAEQVSSSSGSVSLRSAGSRMITASARASPALSGSRIGPDGKTEPSPKGHSSSRVSPSTTIRLSVFFSHILVGVVQNEGLRARGDGGFGPGDRGRADPGRAVQRQHQGLVADVGGGVDGRDRPGRALQLAAIAARQGVGLDPRRAQQAQDLARDGRLARSADGQIADGDDRHARIDRRRLRDAAMRSRRPRATRRASAGCG
jgi:hypothetical protein